MHHWALQPLRLLPGSWWPLPWMQQGWGCGKGLGEAQLMAPEPCLTSGCCPWTSDKLCCRHTYAHRSCPDDLNQHWPWACVSCLTTAGFPGHPWTVGWPFCHGTCPALLARVLWECNACQESPCLPQPWIPAHLPVQNIPLLQWYYPYQADGHVKLLGTGFLELINTWAHLCPG